MYGEIVEISDGLKRGEDSLHCAAFYDLDLRDAMQILFVDGPSKAEQLGVLVEDFEIGASDYVLTNSTLASLALINLIFFQYFQYQWIT